MGDPATNEQEQQQEEDNVVHITDNKRLRQKVLKAFKAMIKIDERRAEINAEADKVRAELVNEGIPKAAFNAAYSRYKMDEDKRKAHDAAFAVCCNAGGVGYQQNLFDSVETEEAGE